ncbi:MAG TPA: serine hydrolase domain-containing protein [Vicinamibacterales bacterium]
MTRPITTHLVVGAVIGAAMLSATPRAQDAPSARAIDGLRTFYQRGLEDNAIVGSGLLVIHEGQAVASLMNGMADVARQHAVDADTIFHWASITKTFTAVAIMQLRDRGRLTLDDPVVKYLPELRQVHDPFGDISDITIRHLMTHSAGFRGPTWPWGGDKPWHPFEPRGWAQIVAMLPYTEVEFRPGSRHSYSNPGIIFLGRIIEDLTGDDYEVYIDKNIFKPLGMSRSYFDTTPYHLLPHRSASYYVENGRARPAPFDADTGITVSNGGLNAPLTDMAKYLAFLIGGDAQRTVHDGVLKRSSLEEMFVPQLPVSTEGGDRVAIGLNFFVEDRDGLRLIGHSGNQNGFIAHFYVCPAIRAGYVVAFNTTSVPTGKGELEKTQAFDAALRGYILRQVFPTFARVTPATRGPSAPPRPAGR